MFIATYNSIGEYIPANSNSGAGAVLGGIQADPTAQVERSWELWCQQGSNPAWQLPFQTPFKLNL